LSYAPSVMQLLTFQSLALRLEAWRLG